MSIPKHYEWITSLRGLPRTIRLALDEYGVQEVVGKGSNKTIIGWRDELNQAGVSISGYSDDDIPWCGLFAAIVCYRRLKNANDVVANPLWARNWAGYGVAVASSKNGKLVNVAGVVPSLGDILTFVRNGGGHVGFYIGEDSKCFHVIGGNQSNKVCITRIEKSRCIAVRRPTYAIVPRSCIPFTLAASGIVSTNEA